MKTPLANASFAYAYRLYPSELVNKWTFLYSLMPRKIMRYMSDVIRPKMCVSLMVSSRSCIHSPRTFLDG